MTIANSLTAAAEALENNVDELTRLDSIVGDGDLGLTAGKVAAAIREAVAANTGDTSTLLQQCGRRIAGTAASSCGTLIATAFLSASKLDNSGSPREQLAAALTAAQEGIQKRGKAAPGDRTLLDALAPAADTARKASADLPWDDIRFAVAASAQKGMEATKTMTPRIGRARSQPERALGNPDAGAVLVAVAFNAALTEVS
ncbi:DAK2 domain-containing protein [Rhodococcoides kyotonense]|uniref:Dihydroxyacetone kinase/dihydroxyacetone kinase, C-terminal domain n=1 Tax=Rhodococcoides kyotonense TaxID=398843 RepID=A0A239N060_9NOCA|nr:DAK2 domain-containing protein [Rhodococcus kyotonensis]SNT47863.1 dihydroxyacetone kinase/dihydroxyacetone kinase, C-terminal domain [Rhodococcus kyotonensis]